MYITWRFIDDLNYGKVKHTRIINTEICFLYSWEKLPSMTLSICDLFCTSKHATSLRVTQRQVPVTVRDSQNGHTCIIRNDLPRVLTRKWNPEIMITFQRTMPPNFNYSNQSDFLGRKCNNRAGQLIRGNRNMMLESIFFHRIARVSLQSHVIVQLSGLIYIK